MNLKTLSIIPLILLSLTGCVADGTLVPKKNDTQDLHNIQVTYILPSDIETETNPLDVFSFRNTTHNAGDKIERLSYKPTPNGIEVHRRNDNNIAGSGIIYDVNVNVTRKSGNTIITLIPKTQKTYQEGLILPFPIPSFDIEHYLSSSTIKYRFEVDSEYRVDSIKANFDRVLSNPRLELNNMKIDIEYKVFPYRNGSKIIISAEFHTQKSRNGVIDVTHAIEEVKRTMQSIINS